MRINFTGNDIGNSNIVVGEFPDKMQSLFNDEANCLDYPNVHVFKEKWPAITLLEEQNDQNWKINNMINFKHLISGIFIASITILSCIKNKKTETINARIIMDTLYGRYKSPQSSQCNEMSNGYYKKFGIFISNFYEVSSYIPYDFNNDGKVDTIAVLSPFTSIPMTKRFRDCNNKNIDNRLLIFIENMGEKNKLFKIYSNIISNEISTAWEGSESLKSEKDGFNLIGDKGQGCKYEYTIFFKQKNVDFFLDNIKLSYYCPDKPLIEKRYQYSNKEILLNLYNRNTIDSLKLINGF